MDTQPTAAAPGTACPSLKDLLEDGIYLLFLIRNGQTPSDAAPFSSRLDALLSHFDRQARDLDKPIEAIQEAKYAFCALTDEIILAVDSPLRDTW